MILLCSSVSANVVVIYQGSTVLPFKLYMLLNIHAAQITVKGARVKFQIQSMDVHFQFFPQIMMQNLLDPFLNWKNVQHLRSLKKNSL